MSIRLISQSFDVYKLKIEISTELQAKPDPQVSLTQFLFLANVVATAAACSRSFVPSAAFSLSLYVAAAAAAFTPSRHLHSIEYARLRCSMQRGAHTPPPARVAISLHCSTAATTFIRFLGQGHKGCGCESAALRRFFVPCLA